MRVGLMGHLRRIWAPRGMKVRQDVEECKREWTYLNVAVNGLIGSLFWDWAKDMKGESIASIVKRWGEEGMEVIVWDRARGHRGKAYTDVCVKLIEQPSYSPELNPAERVFEYLRSKVEGKVYGTLTEKKRAIEAELEKLASQPEMIKSLAGWDWIRESVENLPTTTVFT